MHDIEVGKGDQASLPGETPGQGLCISPPPYVSDWGAAGVPGDTSKMILIKIGTVILVRH